MNTHQKRAEIIKVYRTETWKQRCMKMSDAQVHAIFTKFKKEGTL